jgi:serine phosphatase RsbU (regulator of sigma subunit)
MQNLCRLSTDGLLEAENAGGQSFGDEVLPTFIQEKQGTEQFADLLLSEVLAWSSNGTQPRQEDDITMLVIDFHELRP